MSEIQARRSLSKVVFLVILDVIKPNRFCYHVQNKGFREKLVCVIVSLFLIFMFVDHLLLVDVFSQLYYLTYANAMYVYRFHGGGGTPLYNRDGGAGGAGGALAPPVLGRMTFFCFCFSIWYV